MAAVVLGVTVLTGWALDLVAFTSILPGLVTMKPNTAAGLVLGGVAVWLLAAAGRGTAGRWTGRAAAGSILLLGVLTASEYAFGWDLGIDQALFRDPTPPFTTHPGRMSVLATVNFALLGAALVVLDTRRAVSVAQSLVLPCALLSLLALFGEVFWIPAVPGPGATTPMASHTALGFLMLATGLLVATADRGILRPVRRQLTVVGLVASLALLLTSGIGSFRNAQRMAEASAWVVHTHQVLRQTEGVLANLQAVGAAQRGFAVTGLEAFLAPAPAAREALVRNLTSLLQLTLDDPDQQRRLAALQPLIARRLAHAAESERVRREGGAEAASRFIGAGEGERLMTEVRTRVREMQRVEEDLLAGRRADAVTTTARSFLALGLNAVAGLTLLAGLLVAVRRYNTALESRVEERTAALTVSERHYRDLADSALVGIYRSTLQGEIQYVNPALARMLGLDSPEAVKRDGPNARWRKPEDRQELMRLLQRDGSVESYEGVVVTATGEPRHFLGSAKISGDELTGTLVDITERKRVEEALRISEDRFRRVFENAAIGIALVDMEGHPIRSNPALQRILGYSEAELAGMAFTEFTHPDDAQKDWGLYTELMEGRRDSYAMEKRYIHKDGQVVWGNLTVSLVRDRDGGPEYGIGMVEDVTDRKRADQEIRTLNVELEQRVRDRTHQLEEANRELESFSYSVSHDLRAPLRHIHGYAEMLERATSGQLTAEAQRYLKTIGAASAEMDHLIDDLLAFARMARAEMREARVCLDDLVQNTIQGLDMVTAGRNIVWQVAPLPAVEGDPALLRQVLVNLIDNAVKYSRMRDPARIEIGCSGEEDGRVILFVRDNGAGFDMRYAARLFGVFERLHRADEFEGTGVGLAAVRRIVARHGGRVWAEAAPNQGAAFYFTLKRSAAA